MNYLNQEEQEYRRFILKCENKANEITKEYNKLSDKNRYRFCMFLQKMIWTIIVSSKW